MLTVTLCLILVLNQATLSRQCNSDYPVAFMCQTGEVRGRGVTLDVSTAAATNYSSCSCSVTSNITGFIVQFEDNPNTTDCGVQLDLLFKDVSMQLKCGVPSSGQSTTGRTAQIHYTRDTDVDIIDSGYCLSFHANRSDVEFTLSCEVRDQTTKTTTTSQSSSMTTSSPSGSVQTSPYNTTTTFSLPYSASQTSLSTTLTQNSTSLPAIGTSSVLQSSNSTITATSSNSTPTTSSTISSVSAGKTESTRISNESTTSLTSDRSTSINITTVSSFSTTDNKTIVLSTPTARNTSSTATVSSVNVTRTTHTPHLNTTFTARNATVMSTKLDSGNITTLANNNNTFSRGNITFSTSTLPMSTDNSSDMTTIQNSITTTTNIANEANTTDYDNTTRTTAAPNPMSTSSNTTQTTTTPLFMNVTTHSEVHTTTMQHDNITSDGLTDATDYTVTTDVYGNYTPTISTTYSTTTESSDTTTEFTTQTTDVSTTITTPSTNATEQTDSTTTETYTYSTAETNTTSFESTTDVTPETTKETNFPTTETYSNITAEMNTTSFENTTAVTPETTKETNFTTTETYSNITATMNTTSIENTTDVTPETTVYTNVTTTGLYNETADNSTADTNITVNDNTTAKQEQTTAGFWEPPIQNYDVPSRSNNIIIILVPVAGILLIVFIGVVVYIMCKRSKAASRRTRVPNTKNKADKNSNIKGRGNIMEQNKTNGVNEKPENPRDMFAIQSNGKYPAKYKTENENTDTDKANLTGITNEEQLLKEQFSTTLNGKSLDSSGKPKSYEPTEREKDLLDHLELSTIVIESDPDDSNRYFKKTDPGDWYRIIMKGKKARDSDEKRTHGRKKKSKSSGSENELGETQHRRKKHRDRKHRRHSELSFSDAAKRKSKYRHSSSDSFDKTLSDDTDMTAPKTVNQTRHVMNRPNQQATAHSESHYTSQPRQVISKPVNNQESKPEPTNTRIIVTKPSSVSMPSPVRGNDYKNTVIQTDSNPGGQRREDKHLNSESFSSSTSSGSEYNTAPQRNTALRSSQTRNNLFGSGSKLNAQNRKEKDADTNPSVKRPDIVPPLNLTETGDKVGRTEDGFEEFLLSEC